MREIKFRAKRKDNGEWVYGYYVKSVTKKNKTRHFIVNTEVNTDFNYGSSCIGWKFSNVIEVIPETVGQYTGLKDKNNKECYEGDILKITFYDYDNGYENSYGVTIPKEYVENIVVEIPQIFDSPFWWECDFDNKELIGNIHDNSEMLEGDE